MKKRLLIFWLVLIILTLCSISFVGAMQCRAGSHTFSGGTETSDQVYCIPDIGQSGPVKTQPSTPTNNQNSQPTTIGDTGAKGNRVEYSAPNNPETTTGGETPQYATLPSTPTTTQSPSWDNYYSSMTSEQLDQEYDKAYDDFTKCDASNEVAWTTCITTCDYSRYNCDCYNRWYPTYDTCWKAEQERDDAITRALNAAYDREYAQEQQEEQNQQNTNQNNYQPSTGLNNKNQQNTNLNNKNLQNTNKNSIQPTEEDSAQLLESVVNAGKKNHNNEVQSVQNYYTNNPIEKYFAANPPTFIDPYITAAEKNFEKTRPLGEELVNARGEFRDSISKGAPDEERLAKMDVYEAKLQELKTNLKNTVLSQDSNNVDALWQMGTLSKWEGNNKDSYEYYRDALMAAKSKNVFKYQQLLDSINNPAIRIQLLQSMEPNENIITLPTTETSSFLKGLDNNIKALTKPVTQAKQDFAETIEKLSRAFSLSDNINAKGKDLGFSSVGREK